MENNLATKMHLYLSFVAPEMSLFSPLVSLLSNMFTNNIDARVEDDIFIFGRNASKKNVWKGYR